MSATVLTEDVLFHIVSHLSATRSQSVRRTLVRLAQTHSTLTKPALAVLWRSLPSTKALEHLLCVVGIAQHHPSFPLKLCGTLATHESGWARFQEYSVLVQEITFDPFVPAQDPYDFDDDPEDTFWCKLSSAFNVTSILPCLKVVTLRSSDSVRFSTLNAGTLRFLSPSVRAFNVHVPSVSPEGRSKFAWAFAVCFSSVQDLEAITLDTLVPVLDVRTLPQLHPRMRHIELQPSIEPDDVLHLSSLHSLEHLSISVGEWEPSDLPIKFTALRGLEISTYKLSAINAFVTDVDAPTLRSFTLSENHRDAKEMHQSLTNVLRTLAAKWPSLTAFHWKSSLWYGGDGGDDIDTSGAMAELLAPLLPIRTIRDFSVSFKGPTVPYSPADFRAFAEAWPDIETFDLRDSKNKREYQCADLESFVLFAHRCPRLRRLCVPRVYFDPAAAPAAVCPPAPHWLRRLNVASIAFSGDSEQDEDSQEEMFESLMQQLFPDATIGS